MRDDVIITNPELFGGSKKKVISQVAETVIDHDTGQMIRTVTDDKMFVDKEPDYIKIYTSCLLVLNNLPTELMPYLVAFGKWMTYANFDNPAYRCTVRTTEIERHDVATTVGVSDARVKQVIKSLVEAEIFIPVELNGKVKRGIYFVNPWVIGKGEWKDIRQLRANFEFVSGATNIMQIDSTGERKVLMSKTPVTASLEVNDEQNNQ